MKTVYVLITALWPDTLCTSRRFFRGVHCSRGGGGRYLSPGTWVGLVFMDVCGFIIMYKCADCSVEVVLEILTNCCTILKNVSLADASSFSSSGLFAASYPARFETDNKPVASPACRFLLNARCILCYPKNDKPECSEIKWLFWIKWPGIADISFFFSSLNDICRIGLGTVKI